MIDFYSLLFHLCCTIPIAIVYLLLSVLLFCFNVAQLGSIPQELQYETFDGDEPIVESVTGDNEVYVMNRAEEIQADRVIDDDQGIYNIAL